MGNLLHKIKKAFCCPEIILFRLVPHRLLSDRIYLKAQYFLKTGQKLNFDNPLLFNEKIQWLKLYDRHPEYSAMVDKYEVRKYVTQTIGEEYLIPLLGVWNTFDEIPFDTLPDEFVLKCTHDSGSIVICQNERTFDLTKNHNFFKNRLAINYYWKNREWVYKNIKPRIIAEKLMIDESGFELKDYKIFCFNGEPKIIQVDSGRFTDHKRNFYSPEWEYQHFSLKYPTDPHITIEKPEPLELMLDLAGKLSAGKIHVRVDLYVIKSKIYFGELTFYHESGYGRFDPPEWNKVFGDWMILPNH
jgi:hypothetical protein